MNIKEEFYKKGIIKIDSILNNHQLEEFRKSIEKKFRETKKNYIQYDEWDDFPRLLNVIFKNKKFIRAIKNIYKNPIFYPDFIVQVDNYQKHIVPHQDLQSFYRYGDRRELKTIEYSKIGIYLQDSSEDDPTSIYAAECSHNFFLTKISRNLPFFGYKFLKLFRKILFRSQKKLIKLCAGDVLVFDGQVMHSSVIKSKSKTLSPKINIYFSCVGGSESLYPVIKNEFLKFHQELNEKNKFKKTAHAHQRNYILFNPFKNLNLDDFKLLKKDNFFIF